MNNILAIAHKELKSYFSTPIAYVVIGFFRPLAANSEASSGLLPTYMPWIASRPP